MMLTVKALALRASVPSHVVRYYERVGLISAERQRENGYRLFTARDADRLCFIRMAKSLGFTLNEIRQILRHADEGRSPCPDVRAIIAHRIEENRIKIAEMEALQSRMENALVQWQQMPDQQPTDDTLCGLIEAVSADLATRVVVKGPWEKSNVSSA